MITRKTALQEARRFAAALEGPLGARPLQAVVEEFLDFFDDLRGSGASWPQIANLLFAAGVKGRSGNPVSESVLRAIVSRAARRKTAASPGRDIAADDAERRTETVRRPAASKFATMPAGLLTKPQPTGLQSNIADRIRRAARLRKEQDSQDLKRG